MNNLALSAQLEAYVRLQQWPANGFEPQISNLQALSVQHTQWPKNNIFNCYEILVQKADYRWQGSVTRLANQISAARPLSPHY